jgi:ankyrin repeat protein
MDPAEAILSASKNGDYDEVRRLLDQDPSLATASSMLGAQPIHAAYLGGHERVADLLFARGVTLDPFLAAELGMLDEVNRALHADSGFTLSYSAGSTALHRACYWGQVEVAKLLLDHAADANAVTKDTFLQIRPLGCAVATPGVPNPSDREEVVVDLVSLLIARGADVNGRRRDGLTALHSAAYRGHLGVIDLLLKHGADVALRGHEGHGPHAGQTAADLADAQGHTDAAALLRAALTAW